MARVAAEGIPLTVCPRSNVVIANRFHSLEEHPLLEMRDAGLLVTINTDDPAMMEWDIGREYRAVGEAYGLPCRTFTVGRGRDRLHLARRPGPALAHNSVRGGPRQRSDPATGASRAERPGVGFGHHAVHGRATTMTMRRRSSRPCICPKAKPCDASRRTGSRSPRRHDGPGHPRRVLRDHGRPRPPEREGPGAGAGPRRCAPEAGVAPVTGCPRPEWADITLRRLESSSRKPETWSRIADAGRS